MRVPALLTHITDELIPYLSAAENLHRGTLDPLTEARFIQTLLLEQGMDNAKLAGALNHTETWVKGRLELLFLPKDLQERISDKSLSIAGAMELQWIVNDDLRRNVTQRAVDYGASAKTIRDWVDALDQANLTVKIVESAHDLIIKAAKSEPILLECFCCTIDYDPTKLQYQLLCDNCRKAIQDGNATARQGTPPETTEAGA